MKKFESERFSWYWHRPGERCGWSVDNFGWGYVGGVGRQRVTAIYLGRLHCVINWTLARYREAKP